MLSLSQRTTSAFTVAPALQQLPYQQPPQTTTRLYHATPSNNEGFLSKLQRKAKEYLPFLQTEQEKRAAEQRKLVKQNVNNGISQLFKDAPLPVRVVGKMMAPIFSGLLSELAETAASQQEIVDQALGKAKAHLMNDDAVRSILGDSVSVGVPFSTSSSSSSINGQTTSRVELGFPVSGSRGSGIGRMMIQTSNDQTTMQDLVVEVNGRRLTVDTSGGYGRSFAKTEDDNIIEAEIIEKDTKP